MRKKSTMEVCAELGVSRTTFKAWVYDILGRKQVQYDNTLLEFTEEEVVTLWQIRFYKQLKYSSSKIQEILNNPDFDISESLAFQIRELTRQKEEIEKMIRLATVMKETGINPSAVRFGLNEGEEIKYDHALNLMEMIADSQALFPEENVADLPEITGEEAEKLQKCFDCIIRLFKKGVDPGHDLAQKCAGKIHATMSRIISESVVGFSWRILFLAPGTESARKIDHTYGKGSSEFLFNVLQLYCSTHADNDFDKDFYLTVENIDRLTREVHSADSDEVQAEVERLYCFFKNIIRQPDDIFVKMFRKLSEWFGMAKNKDAFCDGAGRDRVGFMAKAIEIFCDNMERKMQEVCEMGRMSARFVAEKVGQSAEWVYGMWKDMGLIAKDAMGDWALTAAGRENGGKMSGNGQFSVPTFDFETIEKKMIDFYHQHRQ